MRPLLISATKACLVAVPVMAALSTSALAQSRLAPQPLAASAAAAIDTLFTAYAHSGSPGCAVGVYQQGAVTFARGYGLRI